MDCSNSEPKILTLDVDERFSQINRQLKKGVKPPPETVRTLLQWFGVTRRGFGVNRTIRGKLEKHRLQTEPDFESPYIDDPVSFASAENVVDGVSTGQTVTSRDPTYRVGRLVSTKLKLLSVKPDGTLAQAITLMMTHDISQLPVMTTPRDVKGIVTWKSIGSRLALRKECALVRDCMEPAQIVSVEDSFFSAIDTIAKHDYVLIQARDKQICGIITASDSNEQFRKLAEPFLIVGEIENGIRSMLHGRFTVAELNAAKAPGDDGRNVEGVANLTFGEYIRLLESDSAWKKLGLHIDKTEFVCRLLEVRDIRNDVMHFEPDGLAPENLLLLQEFARFLNRLRDVGVV